MSKPPHLLIELDFGERRTIPIADDGRSLADVLATHGWPLNTRCGQRGLCHGCEVELRAGTASVEGRTVAASATIKACRARLMGEATVHLPARSRIEHRPQVGETFEIGVPYAHQPLFDFVPGERDTALAVDIGTTTVVVLLVDLVTGEVLSRAGAFNEQIRFGDNVVTRIDAGRNPEALAAMQRAIVTETIQPLLAKACERAGRLPERIAGGAMAGNTTMLHLLVGADPTPLGIAPFTPRFIAGKRVSAGDIGLEVPGLGAALPLQLLPAIAAYLGADITAGVFASGMVFDERPSLLVDIGTNGEIVLQAGGKLFGCATAAGPAFEGCGLRCGTRAREGAVSDLNVRLDPFALDTEVIGNVPLARANGICGSAYVDFLATARDQGILTPAGRFTTGIWDAHLPDAYKMAVEGERAIRIADGNGAGALRVSEVDVALLLQAKAAIGAGIEVLLETAAIRAVDLGRVYLAGGFGMHLDVAHAIAIGLLPGFREEQVRVVGNTSLAGALLALVDRTTLAEMEELRQRVEVIELNLADGFEDRYIEHLLLP
ncbi:MAG: ASKHA domain-containing protein [Verrucomicrobia bacterium]|jgi:uncharacterized 2Fe-2S/4Fe-4S cluster protein (DUF4445 family)|nr:ASKHA domain-containing protein [Verrucomicrobiota bacterium]